MADEPKQEEQKSSSAKATDDKEEKSVEVPAKFKDLVEQVEKLSVLELAELVKVLEDKFGVSAQAPVAVAAAGAAASEDGAAEEQSTFNVELTEAGASKISVIKVVRELTQKGLADSKILVDSAPAVVQEGVGKEEAEATKKKLEEAGATVTLK